eukprot:scaffold169169_cov38-Prasinocladus_malaysianus.AAC.1
MIKFKQAFGSLTLQVSEQAKNAFDAPHPTEAKHRVVRISSRISKPAGDASAGCVTETTAPELQRLDRATRSSSVRS